MLNMKMNGLTARHNALSAKLRPQDVSLVAFCLNASNNVR